MHYIFHADGIPHPHVLARPFADRFDDGKYVVKCLLFQCAPMPAYSEESPIAFNGILHRTEIMQHNPMHINSGINPPKFTGIYSLIGEGAILN